MFLVVFWVETLFRFSERALYRRAVSDSEMPGSQGVKGSNPLRSTRRERTAEPWQQLGFRRSLTPLADTDPRS